MPVKLDPAVGPDEHGRFQQIILAEKARNKTAGWAVVNRAGRTNLLGPASIQNNDAVGQGERFLLVVRDMDERCPHLPMKPNKFSL
ncbi:hypothetical protein [Bradyrhizobium sp. USDA 4513]